MDGSSLDQMKQVLTTAGYRSDNISTTYTRGRPEHLLIFYKDSYQYVSGPEEAVLGGGTKYGDDTRKILTARVRDPATNIEIQVFNHHPVSGENEQSCSHNKNSIAFVNSYNSPYTVFFGDYNLQLNSVEPHYITTCNALYPSEFSISCRMGETTTHTASECGGSTISLQQGNTRTITCPMGGYVDLWWNFTPDTIPTIGLSPSTVPTTTLAPPTPTSCPTVPTLAWRDGQAHYTRTVVSYDGTNGNAIETIALHLKQITQSGVIVEVSDDNGVSWMATDSSQNDDHVVTIKNRSSEVIHIQVRATNACTQKSEVLTEDVATVPLPSAAMTVTATGTSGTGASLSPATIAAIAAAVVAALIAAGYVTGM